MPLTNAGATACLEGANGLCGTTRYFSLHVGTAGSGNEVSAAGYSRLTRTAGQMAVTNNAVSVTGAEWEDSAQASWGTPTWFGMYDASSAGNLLAYGDINPDLSEITTGTRVYFNDGDITITIALS